MFNYFVVVPFVWWWFVQDGRAFVAYVSVWSAMHWIVCQGRGGRVCWVGVLGPSGSCREGESPLL